MHCPRDGGLKGALEKKMRAWRRTQTNGQGLKGALEGGKGSNAHSKRWSRARRRTRRRWGLEGALKKRWGLECALERRWGLEGALKKEVRARRRTRKKMKAQRRTRRRWGLEGALERKWRLKGALEEGEGSKAPLKQGKVRKRTTLGMRNERWWKNTKIFFSVA